MINQFKYYYKCLSGWETVNFLQTRLDIPLFSQRGSKNYLLCVCVCVCVRVCLFSQFPGNKNYIDGSLNYHFGLMT